MVEAYAYITFGRDAGLEIHHYGPQLASTVRKASIVEGSATLQYNRSRPWVPRNNRRYCACWSTARLSASRLFQLTYPVYVLRTSQVFSVLEHYGTAAVAGRPPIVSLLFQATPLSPAVSLGCASAVDTYLERRNLDREYVFDERADGEEDLRPLKIFTDIGTSFVRHTTSCWHPEGTPQLLSSSVFWQRNQPTANACVARRSGPSHGIWV